MDCGELVPMACPAERGRVTRGDARKPKGVLAVKLPDPLIPALLNANFQAAAAVHRNSMRPAS